MDCSSILLLQVLNLPKVDGSVVGVQDLQGFKILNPYCLWSYCGVVGVKGIVYIVFVGG